MGSLGEGYFVEFSAAAAIALVTYLCTRFGERRRQVKRFYDAIGPVLKTLRDVAEAERLPAVQVQRIVREISVSFSQAYLGGPARLPLRKDLYRPVGSRKTCGICRDTVSMPRDACAHCNLDCCVWDFEKIDTHVPAVFEN